MSASRMTGARPRPSHEHGLSTAAVVRSSQATPARRRGQACGSGCAKQETIAFGAVLPTPAMGSPAWTTRSASAPS